MTQGSDIAGIDQRLCNSRCTSGNQFRLINGDRKSVQSIDIRFDFNLVGTGSDGDGQELFQRSIRLNRTLDFCCDKFLSSNKFVGTCCVNINRCFEPGKRNCHLCVIKNTCPKGVWPGVVENCPGAAQVCRVICVNFNIIVAIAKNDIEGTIVIQEHAVVTGTCIDIKVGRLPCTDVGHCSERNTAIHIDGDRVVAGISRHLERLAKSVNGVAVHQCGYTVVTSAHGDAVILTGINISCCDAPAVDFHRHPVVTVVACAKVRCQRLLYTCTLGQEEITTESRSVDEGQFLATTDNVTDSQVGTIPLGTIKNVDCLHCLVG